MELIKKKISSAGVFIVTVLKWLIVALFVGTVCGFTGVFFHKAVDAATVLRTKNPWIIFLLPLAGLLIVFMYKFCRQKSNLGTNEVFNSIRSREMVPIILAPLIFISTVLSHLFGASVGREGAALQLGGSIGAFCGRILKFEEKDIHMVTLCGMSSVFAALFGTPLAATFFAIEVISIGVLYYSALIPCIASSIVAYMIAGGFGIKPVSFVINGIPKLSTISALRVVILAALCAALSIIYCVVMKKNRELSSKYIKNEYLRIAAGGIVIIVLTLAVRTRDYNSAGMEVINGFFGGETRPYDFILKMLFTAICVGVGFKGGEIIPTFFIGAAFGSVIAPLIGLNASFGAAVGLISLFCAVVNCPVASIILSLEMFGYGGFILFAVACCISYTLSGYYGLYSSQKIVYSKLRTEFINISTK